MGSSQRNYRGKWLVTLFLLLLPKAFITNRIIHSLSTRGCAAILQSKHRFISHLYLDGGKSGFSLPSYPLRHSRAYATHRWCNTRGPTFITDEETRRRQGYGMP